MLQCIYAPINWAKIECNLCSSSDETCREEKVAKNK
ncbi:unnamed protein product [Spirodela intermedia]|uniref:Uncharacterized protein n=1 Tax=Spirodela intermedia TaxID=51605 RepID=A0ABN7ED99_SPIIN|nr:unnamed protein product [Spirodela intermedia]